MNEPRLFEPALTMPRHCPHCGAVKLPGQDRAPTCAWDLERERKRPAGCVNAVDPRTAPFPPGY